MTSDLFVSYAQNGEDVLLWRALGHVRNGRYVDVGAADPEDLSVTKAFYERGWRGVDIDPVPQHAEALRAARPEDEVVEAAITATGAETLRIHEIHSEEDDAITGLSTIDDDIAQTHGRAGFAVVDLEVATTTLTAVCESEILDGEIHFLKIDVEGAEADVLRSMDFTHHRPWVVLVEATKPLSTEARYEDWDPILVEAGYEFVLFDGLSRYYVARERAELKASLSYPVCVFDEFITSRELGLRERIAAAEGDNGVLWGDLLHWRGVALDSWAQGFADRERIARELKEARQKLRARSGARVRAARDLQAQLDQMESSASWRVTRPLRWVRSRMNTPRPDAKADDR